MRAGPVVAALVASLSFALGGPLALAEPPEPPDRLSATTVNGRQHTVSLNWRPPSPGTQVVVQADSTDIPATGTSGTRVYSGLGSSVVTSALADDTQYFFRVFSTDGSTYAGG